LNAGYGIFPTFVEGSKKSRGLAIPPSGKGDRRVQVSRTRHFECKVIDVQFCFLRFKSLRASHQQTLGLKNHSPRTRITLTPGHELDPLILHLLRRLPMSPPLTTMTREPIVILGAGIGGLTLQRCLYQRGIPCIVHDRVSSSFPRHNYGITLHEWAYKPLLQVLGMDERSFRRRVAVDSLYHAGTGKVYPDESTSPLEVSCGSFRANRSKLEHLLREGQHINWGHDLQDAKAAPDGGESISLAFQKSLKVSSSFIVDALGIHSKLRKSLLPDCTPEVLPYVVFSGKRQVEHDQFLKTHAPYLKNANTLNLKPTNDRNVLLQISVSDHTPEGDTDIRYVYSRPARSDHHQQPDPLHNPDRSKISATQIPEAFYDELQLLSTGAKLREPFSSIFNPSKIRCDRLHHWLMRTLLVDAANLHNLLFNHGIVMIGESAHAMPILGGDGANHTIKDAVELAEVIATSTSGSISDESTRTRLGTTELVKFYDKCAKRWRDGVTHGQENIACMHL
jgi:2-polyprenyl-6-methoxyphenol hydroxylase-like FAD-dependent oxidoreductase